MPTSNFPHDFSQLRVGPRRPFLVIGAGMSFGLVLGPKELLAKKQGYAEATLGCHIEGISPDEDRALYKWAGLVLDLLNRQAQAVPKLLVAEALGLLSDPEWTAGIGIPLRGTTPRHRVIARLVREKRWAAIWSLNWDCHLENALERIGLNRGEPRVQQPWFTAYRTVVTTDDFPHLGREDLFCIVKPHGCVQALSEARRYVGDGDIATASRLAERFMITESELARLGSDPADQKFAFELASTLSKSPLMTAGWSISEPYLATIMEQARSGGLQTNQVGELTIIDIHFNEQGHQQATGYYGMTKERVFMGVDPDSLGFNTDRFFLWVQAKYALDQLLLHAPDSIKPHLLLRASFLSGPLDQHFLMAWADDFLPAWTRLCWRADLVQCVGYAAHQLRLELEDEHVPWHLGALPRPDLAAAAILLLCLPDDGDGWDPSRFPGGLWDDRAGRLVVPLPSWGELNELAAINPLLRVLEREIGFVSQLDIAPIPHDLDGGIVSPEKIEFLKRRIASTIRLPRFASADQIGIASDLLPPAGVRP